MLFRSVEDRLLDEPADELFRVSMHDVVTDLLAAPIVVGELVTIGVDPAGRVTASTVTRR